MRACVGACGIDHCVLITTVTPCDYSSFRQIICTHSGPRIELGAEHGCVFVDKYVEGDVSIRAQRVSLLTSQIILFAHVMYVSSTVSRRLRAIRHLLIKSLTNYQQLHARMLKGSRIRVQVSNPVGQPLAPPPAPEGHNPSEAAEAPSTIKEEEESAPVTVEALFGNRASVLCTALAQGERARRVRCVAGAYARVRLPRLLKGVRIQFE